MLSQRGCEHCHLGQCPTYGLPCEWRRRWCAACAKVHAGARDLTSKLCEDCGLKQPSYAHPADGLRRRWCSACATAHEGARSVTTRKRRMPTASVAALDDPSPVTAPKAGPGPNGDCPRRTRVWTLLPPPAPVHEPLAVSAAQEPCAKRVCAPSPLGAALKAACFPSKPSRTTATISWAHSHTRERPVSLSNPAAGRLHWDSLVLMCCSWETCLAC